MKPLAFAARSLRREFHQAELATLALALCLAVAALAAVATLASRVEQSLLASAAELLGGDLGISASRPLPPALREEAERRGLQVSLAVDFPSMLFAGERSRLSAVQASDAAFPLRGRLRVRRADGREADAHAPPRGALYVDPELPQALGVELGQAVQIGDRELRLEATIVESPDAGDLLRFAPRVLMNLQDAEAGGLLGAGSRARYRLLLAGAPRAIAAYAAWAATELPEGARLETVQDAQRNLRSAFERGQSFLRLAALLAALLAGIAVALAAQRFARRRIDQVALLRCLGARCAEIRSALLLQLLLVGVPAGLAGLALGLALQQLALGFAAPLLPGAPPPLPWGPPLAAFAVGLAVLFGFALPPLLRLIEIPPLHVLRRRVDTASRRFDALYLLPLALAAALILAGAGSLRLAGTLALGLGGVTALSVAGVLILLPALRRGGARIGGAWRLGLAGLARRRGVTLLQTAALALGLTALALLGAVGPSLLEGWRAELAPDTPNWFAVNLQPTQRAGFERRLAELGAGSVNLLPLAVGKLTAIDGQRPDPASYEDRRAAGWLSGEVRLSWSAELPPANRVIAGRWFSEPLDRPELSVARMWQEMFRLRLGDRMRLRVGEREIEAAITSFREVDWDSFRANFFLMLDPASGAGLPHGYIASFHLDAAAGSGLAGLAREFPNLSLIDVEQILERVRGIVARVSQAATWVLGFSLLAGLLVLLAALAATADERRREAALLRTLGAVRAQLSSMALAEFVALGLIAATVAALGASLLGFALAHLVFHLDAWTPPFTGLIALILGATASITVAGWLGTLRILRAPPISVLRRV